MAHIASPECRDGCIAADLLAGDARIIRKFYPPPFVSWEAMNADGVRLLAVLDVETTGLSDEDEIIEIAVAPLLYDSEDEIVGVLPPKSWLQQPSEPIPPKVARLTGIDDDMVWGKSIDEDALHNLVSAASCCVSHNAAFDRYFCEELLPVFEEKPWACSIADVHWRENGVASSQLDFIAMMAGFYTDNRERHRAETDCLLLCGILGFGMPDERSVLQHLLQNARRISYRVYAAQAPFDSRFTLKSRGYRWDSRGLGAFGCWIKDCHTEIEAWSEAATLERTLQIAPHIRVVDATLRYSRRVHTAPRLA